MSKEEIIDESDQSKFNAGIATLMRLNELKKWLAIETIRQEPAKHFLHLKAYWKELDNQFPSSKKDNSQEEQLEKFKEMFKHNTAFMKGELSKVIFSNYLDMWEIELRRLEQKYGLNMPKELDSRWAMSK